MLALKTCAECKRDLPLLYFAADPSTKSGLHSYCRECKSRYERRRKVRKNALRTKKRKISYTLDTGEWG